MERSVRGFLLLEMAKFSQIRQFPWHFYFRVKSDNTDFEILTGLGPNLRAQICALRYAILIQSLIQMLPKVEEEQKDFAVLF